MPKYYPISQLTTNLSTNGDEFKIVTTNEPYQGLYYTTSDGSFFTGKNPQDGPSFLLTPIKSTSPEIDEISDSEIISTNFVNPNINVDINQKTIANYLNITKPLPTRYLPISNPTLPTSNDYKNGEFQRYFTKKTNELIYIEIDKITYNKLLQQDPTIAFDLYNPISLPWNLTGDEKQVYQSNKNIVELVERENNWYGFTSYFQKDFSKYYLAS